MGGLDTLQVQPGFDEALAERDPERSDQDWPHVQNGDVDLHDFSKETIEFLSAVSGVVGGDAEETQELQALLDSCAKAHAAGDPDAYYYENERFHDCIYRASHNSFLAQQARQLQTRLKPYRRLQLRVRNRAGRSLAEHREIVAAILAGDEHVAETTIQDHVRIQGERFTDFVATVGKRVG